MRAIKRRIRSVDSTRQITKAMELVASSKLRRAKETAERARPYFNILYEEMCEIAENPGFQSHYTVVRPVKTKLLIVIAGDRGLAGGYNSNVFRLAHSIMQGVQAKVVTVGKRATEYFTKRGFDIIASYDDIADNVDVAGMRDLSFRVMEEFREGRVDEVDVIYTNFVSQLVQQAGSLKLLPLEGLCETAREQSLTLYEPSPEAVFTRIIPQYISGVIYGAVIESYASEQGARRTAMEAASDSASEMIDELSLRYNRARQAAITNELIDIIGGANASQ